MECRTSENRSKVGLSTVSLATRAHLIFSFEIELDWIRCSSLKACFSPFQIFSENEKLFFWEWEKWFLRMRNYFSPILMESWELFQMTAALTRSPDWRLRPDKNTISVHEVHLVNDRAFEINVFLMQERFQILGTIEVSEIFAELYSLFLMRN